MQERHLEVIRTARYYVLGNETGSEREVWFVLHGYGQLARDFIGEFTVIADESRRIVAPEGLSRFYSGTDRSHGQMPVGATWMTREDRECEIEDYIRYLDRLYGAIGPDSARVRVLGFSQATATASRWAAFGESRIDQLILWGGGFAEDLDLERYRSRIPAVTIVLGERDDFLNRDKVAAQQQRIPSRLLTFAGGHRLDRDILRKLAEE